MAIMCFNDIYKSSTSEPSPGSTIHLFELSAVHAAYEGGGMASAFNNE